MLPMVSANSIRLTEQTEDLAARLLESDAFPAVRIVSQKEERFAISRDKVQLAALRLAIASTHQSEAGSRLAEPMGFDDELHWSGS